MAANCANDVALEGYRMDASCLIGLCAAAAQAVAPETAASQAAESESSTSAGRDISLAVTWLGIAVLVIAQSLAPLVLRRYRAALETFMRSKARSVLGLAGQEDAASWSADTLLQRLERQRLTVLWVLIGVVVVYSLAAAALYAYELESGSAYLISLSVSFLMFLAFSGPVVLLGVSAARFARHFWTYFAPSAFAAVAMQIIVAKASSAGDIAGAENKVLIALGTVMAVTGLAVLLREKVPLALWQRLAAGWRANKRKSAAAAGIALLALLGSLGESEVSAGLEYKVSFWQMLILGCAFSAIAITLCYFAMVDRVKRIIVPLVAASLFTVLVFGASFAALLLGAVPGGGLVKTLLIVLAVGLGCGVAYLMLGWIGLAYDQKVFSEAQFQVYTWMVSVAGVVIFAESLVHDEMLLTDPLNGWLALATLVALAAYSLLIRLLVKPLPTNKRLLVLRVFAPDNRREGLLDELEYRWRFIGPIVLIGASDFAARTIDPAKAANFLRRKLRNVFIPDRHQLNKRIAAMDETPDPDGRYRLSEFFCFDDVWQDAVQLLLDSSEAIVLDLRDFNAKRLGTAYEIGLLADHSALPRTLFLVSPSTDMDAVRMALQLPVGATLGGAQVMEVTDDMDGKILVEALVRRLPQAPLPELALNLKFAPPAQRRAA